MVQILWHLLLIILIAIGHADVALTLQVYSHSYDTAQQNAAKKLGDTITELKQSS